MFILSYRRVTALHLLFGQIKVPTFWTGRVFNFSNIGFGYLEWMHHQKTELRGFLCHTTLAKRGTLPKTNILCWL